MEFDYVANFKLLQNGFEKKNHKKYIEVMKLVKCKYQDNLEFAQWLHAMWKMHGGSGNSRLMMTLAAYDAEESRGYVKIEDIFGRHVETKEAPESHAPKEVKPRVGIKLSQSVIAPKITNVVKPSKPTQDLASQELNSQERMMLHELRSKLDAIRALVSVPGEPGTTVHQIRGLLGIASFVGHNEMDLEAVEGQQVHENQFGSAHQSEYDQSNSLVLE